MRAANAPRRLEDFRLASLFAQLNFAIRLPNTNFVRDDK